MEGTLTVVAMRLHEQLRTERLVREALDKPWHLLSAIEQEAFRQVVREARFDLLAETVEAG